MNYIARILVAASYFLVLIILQYFIKVIGGSYALLDSAVLLLGILFSVLMMFAFVEYAVLGVVNSVVHIILYVVMIKDAPEYTCFLVFEGYSLLCSVLALFRIKNIYKTQQYVE